MSEEAEHNDESNKCDCEKCVVMRKLGYTTYLAWSEAALKPIVESVTKAISDQCNAVDAKQVEGVLTPEEAAIAKSVIYSDSTHQIMHIAAHFSHAQQQRISEFVGEAAEHWNIARPRPSLGGLIPLSREMLESLRERITEADPFSMGHGKKEPGQPN